MLKKSHYIAAGLIVLASLILLNLPSRTTARLKLAIGSLFVPLFGLTTSAQRLAGKSADALVPRSELARQNELLRRENQQFRLQLQQAEEIARENARLRQSLARQDQSPWKPKLKLASVVLREPANWWRSVWIDLGTRDGISENLTVVTADGLVGRVTHAGQTRSQVTLVGDPNCKVAAVVQETRDPGVIGSLGPLDTSLVEMSLFGNANLKPGQNVTTSGSGGIFPKGIHVGRIVDTHPGEYGLYTQARVKLGANLAALEEAWVLMP